MLISTFRSKQPYVLLLLLLLVPALWSGSLIDPPEPLTGRYMPLFELLLMGSGDHAWAPTVAGMVITLLMALLLNAMFNDLGLTEQYDQLTALVYATLIAVWPEPCELDPALCASPFLLLAIRNSWSIQGLRSAHEPLFKTGLLLGIAALFYAPIVLMIIVVWIGTSLQRTYQWRDYLLPVVGMVLPIYLCYGVIYVLGADLLYGPAPVIRFNDALFDPSEWGWSERILGLLIIGLTIVSSLKFSQRYFRSIVREKNIKAAFLSLALLMTCMAIFESLFDRHMAVPLFAFPGALLYSYFFRFTRPTWIPEVVFTILLTLAFWDQWA